ncbi:MAG: GAF domain-containing protein [Anaerolineae bacterium]
MAAQHALRRLLPRGTPERTERIRTLGCELSARLTLTDVADFLTFETPRRLGVASALLLQADPTQGLLVPVASERRGVPPVSLGDPALEFLSSRARAALRSDLEREVRQASRLREVLRQQDVDLVFPLHARSGLVGLFCLGSGVGGGRPSPDEVGTLEMALGHAATVLENARLHAAEAERARQAEALLRIGQLLASGLEPEGSLPEACELLRDLLRAHQAAVLLATSDGEGPAVATVAGEPGTSVRARLALVPQEAWEAFAQGGPALAWDEVTLGAKPAWPALLFPEAGSLVAAPLRSQARTLGWLVAAWKTPRRCSPEVVGLAEAVAGQMGAALENARLYREAQERFAQAQLLLRVSTSVASTLDVAEVLRRLAREMAHALEADMTGAYLLDEMRETLRPVAGYHVPPEQLEEYRTYQIPLRAFPLVEQAWRTGRATYAQDAPHNELVGAELLKRFPAQSVLFVPMRVQDRMIGGLFAVWWSASPALRSEDLALAEAIAGQAAIAAENARLYGQTDRLLQARLDQLMALQRVSRALNATLDLGRIMHLVLEELLPNTHSDRAFVAFLDREAGRLELRDAVGYGEEEREALELALRAGRASGPLQDVLKTARPSALKERDRVREACGVPGGGALLLPLFYEGEVAGLIGAARDRAEPYREAEVEFGEALATQASLAIANALRFEEQVRQREALSRRAQQMSHLLSVSQGARSDRPLEEILEDVAYAIQEAVGFNVVLVSVVEGTPPMLRRVASAGLPLRELEEMKRHPQPLERVERLFQEEFRLGNAYFLPHERPVAGLEALHTYTPMRPETKVQEGQWHPEDMLLIPLRGATGQLVGLISVDDPQDRLRPSRSVVEALEIFAGQAALAIENARLLQEARRRLWEQTLLFETSAAVSSSLNPDEVLQVLARQIQWAIPSAQVLIWNWEEEKGIAQVMVGRPQVPAGGAARRALASLPRTAVALRKGQPLVLQAEDPSLEEGERQILAMLGARSCLRLPLTTPEGPIGFVEVWTEEEHPFTQQEVHLCQTMANQAAAAWRNALYYRKEQQRAEEAEALLKIGQAVGASLELERVLKAVVDEMARSLGVTQSSFLLFDRTRRFGYVAAEYQAHPDDTASRVRIPLEGNPLMARLIEERRPVVVADPRNDPLTRPMRDVVELRRIHSMLVVPLVVRGEVVGAIDLDATDKPRVFREDEVRLCQLLANQAAAAMENASLYADLRRRSENLARLNEVGRLVSGQIAPDEVMRAAAEAGVRLLEAPFCGLFMAEGSAPPRLRAWAGEGPSISADEPGLSRLLEPPWREGRPLLVEDLGEDSRFLISEVMALSPYRSVVAVPLASEEGAPPQGVLLVADETPRRFGHTDQILLSTLADQVATALRKARLYEETLRRADEMTLINEIVQAVGSLLHVAKLFSAVVHGVAERLGYPLVSIYLVQGDFLVLQDQVGYKTVLLRLPISEGIMGRVVRTGEAVFVPDVRQEPDYLGAAPEVVSAIAVPVRREAEVLAVLNVEETRPGALGEADVRVLTALGAQIAVAMENARLYQMQQRRATQLLTINEIGRRAASILEPRELLEFAANAIAQELGYFRVAILLRDEADPEYMEIVAANSEFWPLIPPGYRWGLGEGLIGHAASTGRTILSNRALEDPRTKRVGEWASPSSVSVPIRIGGEVVGVLEVEGETPDAFDAQDQAAMEIVADQLAIALENARLYQDTMRRVKEMTALYEVGRGLIRTMDLDQLLEEVLETLRRSAGYTNCAVLLADPATGELYVRAAKGYRDDVVQRLRLRIGQDGITGWVAAHRQPLNVPDVREDPRYIEGVPGCRSELAVPMMIGDRLIGVLDAESDRPAAFGERDVQLLSAVAAQLAVAIDNVRLFQEAQQRAEEMASLYNIGVAVASTLDLDQVLWTIYEQTSQIMDTSNFFIGLYDEEADALRFELAFDGGERLEPFTQKLGLGESLSSQVVREGRPALVAGEGGPGGTPSWLGVPIVSKDRVIGLLGLQSHEPRAFSAHEQWLLSNIANQAAIALENARLYRELTQFSQELERRVEERTAELHQALEELTAERDRVEALYRITRELSATLDLDRVLQRALELVTEAVKGARGSIMLLDQATGFLVHRAAVGGDEPLPRRGKVTRFRKGVGLAGWVLETGEAVIVPDISQDPRWDVRPGRKVTPQSALAAPLMVGEDMLGVIVLYHPEVGYFHEDHLRLVGTAAAQVAQAIGNAELYRLISDQAERLGAMLRAQQEEYSKSQAILDSIGDGVVFHDPEGKVLLVNPAAARILGGRPETLQGQDVRTLLAVFEESGQKAMRRAIEAVLQTREPRAVQTTVEPEERVVSAHLAPVVTQGGEVLGVVTVLRDITREIEADRAKSEFVSTVSHELRTPMTSIKGYTDLLLMGAVGDLNPQQHHFLEVIKSNADRLTALINDLLDISRIETGRLRLDLQPMHVQEVIEEVLGSLRGRAEAKGLRVRAEVPQGLPAVVADRDRITQVVLNLMDNAVRYTPEGGEVSVRVELADEALLVHVQDTGIGIAPEEQDRIFERFYRSEDARVQETEGTGLGLAIVKSLVEMHGGRVWVESALEKGSTFSFTIPLRGRGGLTLAEDE